VKVFFGEEALGVTQGGTAFSADLGGSSKYSSEIRIYIIVRLRAEGGEGFRCQQQLDAG